MCFIWTVYSILLEGLIVTSLQSELLVIRPAHRSMLRQFPICKVCCLQWPVVRLTGPKDFSITQILSEVGGKSIVNQWKDCCAWIKCMRVPQSNSFNDRLVTYWDSGLGWHTFEIMHSHKNSHDYIISMYPAASQSIFTLTLNWIVHPKWSFCHHLLI